MEHSPWEANSSLASQDISQILSMIPEGSLLSPQESWAR